MFVLHVEFSSRFAVGTSKDRCIGLLFDVDETRWCFIVPKCSFAKWRTLVDSLFDEKPSFAVILLSRFSKLRVRFEFDVAILRAIVELDCDVNGGGKRNELRPCETRWEFLRVPNDVVLKQEIWLPNFFDSNQRRFLVALDRFLLQTMTSCRKHRNILFLNLSFTW